MVGSFALAGKSRIQRQAFRLSAILALVLAWGMLSWRYPSDILPSPFELTQTIWLLIGDSNSWIVMGKTLARILAGLVWCMLLGITIGIVMGAWRYGEGLLKGWVMVLLAMPAIAWAFLGVLWFGVGEAAPIFTIVLVVVPVVILNIWQGVKATDKDLYQMGRAFKADRWLITRKILLPHLMPYIYSSVKIAFALGWKIALIGEVFGVDAGVGREFMASFQRFRVDMMLAWALTFMTLMASVEVFAFRNLDKVAYGWRRQSVM